MENNKERIKIIIDDEFDRTRIDVVLSNIISNFSRSRIQGMIESGQVFCNGEPVKAKSYILKEADILEVFIPETSQEEILIPEEMDLDIIYEDKDLLIINKRKGLVVHPGPGNLQGTLVNGLIFYLGSNLSNLNGPLRPGIVHRLDKDTSGLLLVAKNNLAHAFLQEQLQARKVKRIYHALVHGIIKSQSGIIEGNIGRDPANRLKRKVVREGGKEAITKFRVLERFKNFSYIEAELITGRTHQIRVHMAFIKHPLLGDPLYGPRKSNIKSESQLLHAKTLGFIHPSTKKYMEFDSELNDEFLKIIKKLRHIASD